MEGYRNLLSEDCLGSAETLQGLVRYMCKALLPSVIEIACWLKGGEWAIA
jgi:hypothetical protein